MRHSRKAVMVERYKLYMKKHMFNGKYFVRNVQIGVGLVLVVALIVGMSMMFLSVKEDAVTADAEMSIKAALFGMDVTEESATRKETKVKKTKEKAISLDNTSETVVAQNVDTTQEAESVTTATQEATTEATTEEPSLFDDRCIAKVEETLNVRKEPDSDSDFVGQMSNGAIAKILGTEGEWTKIKSGDVTGYVLSDFILTGDAAESFSKQYVTLTGTVLEDGVNIRADRSTDAEILHVFDKGDTVSVVEVPEKDADVESVETETTEGESTESQVKDDASSEKKEVKASTEETEQEDVVVPTEISEAVANENIKAYATAAGVKVEEEKDTQETENQSVTEVPTQIDWITVCLEDGQIGYVSSEFIEIDELYELAVSAEELQRIEEEKLRQEAEEAARRAMAEAAASESNNSSSTSHYSYDSDNSSSSSNDYAGETTTPVTADSSGDCLGTFTITAYCGCSQCSGGSGLTATGTVPAEGRTIAADTSILPYGTKVVIDGIVYTVEDCGSGVCGNHIDIFFSTHERALAFGRRTMKVYRY